MYLAETEENVVETRVAAKKYIVKTGAYNVHVLGGNIVVNGIVASHFTTESTWSDNDWAVKWYKMSDRYVLCSMHLVWSFTRSSLFSHDAFYCRLALL